jgi:hypothetical protein
MRVEADETFLNYQLEIAATSQHIFVDSFNFIGIMRWTLFHSISSASTLILAQLFG